MREIRVRAIHNRTKEAVRYPTAHGGEVMIPPGGSVQGAWVIRYEEDQHPEMANIATENEVWFIDSPEQITWARLCSGKVGAEVPGGVAVQAGARRRAVGPDLEAGLGGRRVGADRRRLLCRLGIAPQPQG